MSKVMVSLPDDLLARVDGEAERRGLSRSAILREFAADALDSRSARLAKRMAEINARPKTGHGGDVVADLKASRPR